MSCHTALRKYTAGPSHIYFTVRCNRRLSEATSAKFGRATNMQGGPLPGIAFVNKRKSTSISLQSVTVQFNSTLTEIPVSSAECISYQIFAAFGTSAGLFSPSLACLFLGLCPSFKQKRNHTADLSAKCNPNLTEVSL